MESKEYIERLTEFLLLLDIENPTDAEIDRMNALWTLLRPEEIRGPWVEAFVTYANKTIHTW